MHQLVPSLALLAVMVIGHVATAADLHVSPQGNDAWTGTLERPNETNTDGPLASLVGVRDAIRRLKATGALPQPIRVRIQSGEYAIREPIVFEPQDSGTDQCPISYVGSPDERPIISGGRQISGWRKQDGRWVVQLPEVETGQWTFAALWVNGELRTRARMPNDDYFYTAGKAPPITDPKTGKPAASAHVAFRFKSGDIRQFSRIDDAVVVVYQS